MNRPDKFIKENRKFWSQFTIRDSGKKLLIEEPGRIYMKSIFAMIINQAKGYTPVWPCQNDPQLHQLIRSYFPNAEILTAKTKWLPKKLYAATVALFKFVKIFLTKDILGFHYDRVKYGDIIYDMYLAKNKVATIKKINLKLLKIIATYIFRHIKIKSILQNGNYAAVLVSHHMGSSGVMLRAAMRCGCHGYLCNGAGRGLVTLQCFKRLKEIVSPYKAQLSDIRRIIDQLGPRFEKVFLTILKEHMAGKIRFDGGMSAFSKDNKYYTNRASFNKDYKLNPNKKNVFIMLHTFNEFPCSTYRWMLFKDYYKWLMQTLEFAKKNSKVNWIFKQHPVIKYYPAQDVDFKKLFSECPDNVIYIDGNEQINTRSLIHCADLIVTCVGSAGFELPAMGAIPSLIAGDSFYAGLGFALEPKTIKEYFEILNNADKIEKLTPQARKKAMAAYIYIYKICRVKLSIRPPLAMRSMGEENKIIKPEYWEKVCNQYTTNRDAILKELNYYIQAIKKTDFKKLTTKI